MELFLSHLVSAFVSSVQKQILYELLETIDQTKSIDCPTRQRLTCKSQLMRCGVRTRRLRLLGYFGETFLDTLTTFRESSITSH